MTQELFSSPAIVLYDAAVIASRSQQTDAVGSGSGGHSACRSPEADFWRALSWPTAAALPLLTAESGLTRYLEEIRRFPMLEPQEEFMLAKSWREHGDRDAAHKLVTSHLRLVAKIAMGYRGYGLPISEVISEGNVGLMQAVKRFEPDKGFRLATYAMWWIKAAIQEYILRSWSLVKMGTTANQKKLFFNLRKAKSKISALEEGDLRPDQVKLIAKRLGVTEQDVVDMNRRLGGDVSLNAPIREEGDTGEWQDWLVDESASQESRLAESEEVGQSPQGAGRGPLGAQRARAAHLRSAPAGGRSDHSRGARRRVRRIARARTPDRGARLREGPEGGEAPDRRNGAAAHRRARAASALIAFPCPEPEIRTHPAARPVASFGIKSGAEIIELPLAQPALLEQAELIQSILAPRISSSLNALARGRRRHDPLAILHGSTQGVHPPPGISRHRGVKAAERRGGKPVSEDPYAVLGIKREATQDDIRAAYRQLAKKLHPDLNPGDKQAEEKFKQVSVAYDLLGDAEKRARYDRGEIDASGAERPRERYYRDFHRAGAQEHPYSSGGGFADFAEDDGILAELLRRGGGRTRVNLRGPDLHYRLPVEFLEAVNGATRRITMPERTTLDVGIPAGTHDRQILRLRAKGGAGLGEGPPGDALVEIEIRPHKLFTRKDDDIHVELPVSLPEAVLGAKVDVPTPSGAVRMTLPKGANTGTVLRLKGKGVARGDGSRGDELVTLKIMLPDRPDAELEDFAKRWQAGQSQNPRQHLET